MLVVSDTTRFIHMFSWVFVCRVTRMHSHIYNTDNISFLKNRNISNF